MTFLRSDTRRLLRLGKKRRNLQKWRRPKGRHSKIRKGRVGYPGSPSIGHGRPAIHAGLIKGKTPVVVLTIKEIDKLSKDNIVVISRRVGARKKVELIKHVQQKGLMILNVKKDKHETR